MKTPLRSKRKKVEYVECERAVLCRWLGHRWSFWKRTTQPMIDTKTKVRTWKPIQERYCFRCGYWEREEL